MTHKTTRAKKPPPAQPTESDAWKATSIGYLLDATLEAVFVVDAESETLVYANRAARQMTGLRKKDICGLSIRELHPAESTDHVLSQFRGISRKGAVFSRDIPLKLADGSVILTDAQAIPLKVKGRTYLLEFFRNVASRSKAKKRILDAESRFLLAIKSLPMGLHMYKLEPDGSLIFTGANPAADRILDVDNSTYLGKKVEEAFPALRGTELPEAYRRIAARGGVWRNEQVEYNDTHITGAFEVFAFQIKPNEMAAMFWDITERMQAQTEIERFAAVVRSVAQSVMITNPDGNIVYVNNFYEKTTGHTLAEIKGKPIGSLKSGKHDQRYYEDVWKTLSAGKSWTGRFVNRKKDGALFEEEAVISPVRDREGKTHNYVAVKRDMTMELDLEHRMMQSQKMAAIGQLCHRISHDIINSLCAIMGRARLLEDSAHTPDEKALASSVVEATEQISELTGNLMTFANPETLSLRRCNAGNIIRGIEPMIRRICSADISFNFELEDRCFIKADTSRIEQAIMHLIVNSVEAMPSHGNLEIRIYSGTMPATDDGISDDSALVAEIPAVCIEVRDDGYGMSSKDAQRAVEPFFTTKRDRRKNAGLGLATVYGIVSAHAGDITIESTQNKGTRVVIRLPAQPS